MDDGVRTDSSADVKKASAKFDVIIITGVAGSGKSIALAAFEDLGYHTLDNMPLPLLANLLDLNHGERRLAIGLDARSLSFSVDGFLKEAAALDRRADVRAHILMIDASDDTLIRRFSETRRRHPFSGASFDSTSDHAVKQASTKREADDVFAPTLELAIAQERRMIAGVRDCVHAVIDTSYRSSAETRRLIRDRYAFDDDHRMAINIISFAYSRGLPRDADMVFDGRFLRNPHYNPALQPLTGLNSEVANFVKADESYLPFFNQVADQLDFLLPLMEKEGKSYFTLAFGCTGGKHRSVTLAEHMAAHIRQKGFAPRLDHRNLPGQSRQRLGDTA